VTASPSVEPINIHGTGLVLDGAGVLLRGPSGAGKSLLALELLDRQALRGAPGMLVGDDRLDLTVEDDAIVMRAPNAIAGLVELRGRGIVRRPFVASARLDLVVDLVDELTRMLEEDALTTDLLGVTLPRCPVPRRSVTDSAHQMLLVSEALDALGARR
jgi:HPr kinase/phosphorylase